MKKILQKSLTALVLIQGTGLAETPHSTIEVPPHLELAASDLIDIWQSMPEDERQKMMEVQPEAFPTAVFAALLAASKAAAATATKAAVAAAPAAKVVGAAAVGGVTGALTARAVDSVLGPHHLLEEPELEFEEEDLDY
ncbi:MAG: hypothetical protein HRU19_16915 [Pseudobacteriovorax sp.]|nr:hypothetical protein [Pseudobacteriovorax sp.]